MPVAVKKKTTPSTQQDLDDKIATSYAFTVIDLFAGAGGFSLAAKQSGAKLLAAIEFDKWAQETYKRNFIASPNGEHKPILYGDIWGVAPGDLLKDTSLQTKELDLLVGGPPCQGFSSHRLGNAGVDDPRNSLLIRYFDFVKVLKPKVFLVENVSGMLWKKHADYVQKFKNLAKRHGYKIVTGDPQIINSRDFGVPQSRKRVFILGVRSDLELPTDFTWPPEPTHFPPTSNEVTKENQPAWIPASTVFKKRIKKSDPNNIHMQPGAPMLERFKKTPLNGGSRLDSGFTLPCHEIHKGHKDVYGRIDPSKPGPTMTAGCVNPSKGRFVHPTEHNGITARHAARFQTFPDTFIFEGGLGVTGKQIGNAVPVALGVHIISEILKSILKYD
ncbi:DNA cytosine methyltransferase [Rubritalea sp.]|uniref:DNA cytosine methyltransferase n=1 Tax=Rubritalea sp. TaxID=2109375 RepID=UPI003EF36C56